MKEVVKLIDKVVREKRLDAHQGLNCLLDFLIDMFDVRHYLTENGWFEYAMKAEKEEPHLYKIMLIWMDKVATAMKNGSWLDFFGGIYERIPNQIVRDNFKQLNLESLCNKYREKKIK